MNVRESRAKFDRLAGTLKVEVSAADAAYGGAIVPMFASYVFATSDKLAHAGQFATNWDLDGERWAEHWWFA